MQLHFVWVMFLKIGWLKNPGLHGYAYGFSVDCDNIGVNYISDFHRYLMKRLDVN